MRDELPTSSMATKSRRLVRVALTGGPCGGKSSIRSWLAQRGESTSWEAATLLLSRGYPGPDPEHPWTPAWQREFQRELVPVQFRQEEIAEFNAIMQKRTTVWFDRGLPDLSAYWPVDCSTADGQPTFQYDQANFYQEFGLNRELCLARYDLVLHFESLACGDLVAYQAFKSSNPGRFESPEEAKMADERIRMAWNGHPNIVWIKAELSYPEKQAVVRNHLLEIAA